MVGKVFASKSLAQAEHQRLKGTAAASTAEQLAAESQHQRALNDLKGQIAALEAQVKEKEAAVATAQSEAAAAEESYAQLQKAHKELGQELKTLKVEYEPLRQEREVRLAEERQRFEAQSAIAEHLVSEAQAFMTQNPDLPQLISLLQLTRKLKTSITEEKLEPLETSYNQLTAALEDIPAFTAFLEQQAKARGVDMTQWGPTDFSFSRGQLALEDTAEIRPFEELVIQKSIEHGVPPRIEIGAVDEAQRYIDLGVRHFCIGWDRFIYQAELAKIGEGMQKLLSTL